MKTASLVLVLAAAAGLLILPPGLEAQNMPASNDPQMRMGSAIYADTCMACHGPAGAGVEGLFPALAGNPAVAQTGAAPLILIVLQGSHSLVPANPGMPALGWRLPDRQTAAVVTYIRNSWGNRAASVAAGDVAVLRQQLIGTAAPP